MLFAALSWSRGVAAGQRIGDRHRRLQTSLRLQENVRIGLVYTRNLLNPVEDQLLQTFHIGRLDKSNDVGQAPAGIG